MKKIALIIGNSDYPDNKLLNPENDSIAINNKFKEIGIDTIMENNLTQINFKNAIENFKRELDKYEVSILFFAGHGMQIDGENYLCPIDADFRDENFAKHSSIPLNLILDIVSKSNIYTKLFILDACRNNPYEKNFRSTFQRGLAPIYAPIGTIVAYATSPGETASDGEGSNGAYTESLLKHIDQHDLKIEELFKQTRNSLFALTKKKQLSWEHTSLMGDFYFTTSQLTGNYLSNYTITAIGDRNYDVSGDTQIIDIIRKLQSHDWHKQNPAILMIKDNLFDDANINDIFVLGRNIYQAACGNAWDAIEYIKNIRANIKIFNSEQIFHFLNGLAFEIYFDRDGKLRNNFNHMYLNHIIPILVDKEFQPCSLFLKSKLDIYDFRVIYDVTGQTNYIFEIIIDKDDEDKYTVVQILLNSRNILFNPRGSDEYVHNKDYTSLNTRERIKNEISEKIGAPATKINCDFINLPDDENKFYFPDDYSLLNYRINSEDIERNGANSNNFLF